MFIFKNLVNYPYYTNKVEKIFLGAQKFDPCVCRILKILGKKGQKCLDLNASL